MNVILLIFAVTLIRLGAANLLGARSIGLRDLIVPLVALWIFCQRGELIRQRRSPLFVPVALLVLVFVGNYLRNPLVPSGILGIDANEGGLYIYYEIFVGLAFYFIAYHFFLSDRTSPLKLLKRLTCFSTVMCLVGLAMIFVPPVEATVQAVKSANVILPDAFQWEVLRLPDDQTRLGILHENGPLVFIGGLFLAWRYRAVGVLLVLLGVVATFASGGRSYFVSMLLAAFGFGLVTRERLSLVTGAAALVAALPVVLQRGADLTGQFARIFNIFGTLEEVEYTRSVMFTAALEAWRENPLLGVGLGTVNNPYPDGTFEWVVTSNLRFGGHGVYISLLTLTGIVGLATFSWLLWGAFRAAFQARAFAAAPADRAAATYLLFFLVYYAPVMFVEGRGESLVLYGIMGAAAAMWTRAAVASPSPAAVWRRVPRRFTRPLVGGSRVAIGLPTVNQRPLAHRGGERRLRPASEVE